ncbi:Zinc finger CCCH domain-containing protein 44 [Camellia lanceoleosa]|uniref:Zinc finger CCCH domain-containing protein 44 n=1 Tax=Camellia lanceoleosa TaxID=1840588 RepID=A0ACC0H9A1_9ERIC|nr:Zinc finger CCCH domain-containing protein 44 [Camellia lanceoleosa]
MLLVALFLGSRPCTMEVEKIHQMDDSQEVGVPVVVSDSGTEVKVGESGGEGKWKRGRPPRGQAKPPPVKKPKDEEDVCFIYFDGGSRVLCDRRGCPKAYHPACIKRDEAFFRSKAKWNCGMLIYIYIYIYMRVLLVKVFTFISVGVWFEFV